jgi:elongation factor P hydroxylase
LCTREDFFASALHEIAHWCVAGEKRRTLDDFGYWYIPDDRNLSQQKAFEKVEILPQAFEMAFSRACDYEFKVSIDNHSLTDYCGKDFSEKVNEKYQYFKKNGFPNRAQRFINALESFYKH